MGASAAPTIITNSTGWEFQGHFTILEDDQELRFGISGGSDFNIKFGGSNAEYSSAGAHEFTGNIITDSQILLNSPTGPVSATGANLVMHMPSGSIIQGGIASSGSQCIQFLTDNTPHYGVWIMSNAYWDLTANTLSQSVPELAEVLMS